MKIICLANSYKHNGRCIAGNIIFGGYVGAAVDLDENCSLYTEYMLTDDAWAFGTGIVWKF